MIGGLQDACSAVWYALIRIFFGAVIVALCWPSIVHATTIVQDEVLRFIGHRQRQREQSAGAAALERRRYFLGRDTLDPTKPESGGGARRDFDQVLPLLEKLSEGGDGQGAPRSPRVPVIEPLDTLEELYGFGSPQWGRDYAPTRCCTKTAPLPARTSRLLVCHDMDGGYGADRFVQGHTYDQPYRIYDWNLIDIFVYFSHHLVTIPPAGWIDVAHRHGTRILGTFITEWDKGFGVCSEFLATDEKAELAAAQLTRIAVAYGFDGWLINIENKIDAGEEIANLTHFVRCLTRFMRAALEERDEQSAGQALGGLRASSRSTVIWYDSVTRDGALKWQDKLNDMNKPFFDACDGIFTNYTWDADDPFASATKAQARRWDVYTGIDVFGRGTWGGGGFDVDVALAQIRKAGVSAALFAPAWTLQEEVPGGGKIESGQTWHDVEREFSGVDDKFWNKIRNAWHKPRALPGRSPGGGSGGSEACDRGLPLTVNFGRGVGDAWRVLGKEVARYLSSGGWLPTRDMGSAPDGQERRGSFFDISCQCLTPAPLNGPQSDGVWSHLVKARKAGSLATTEGDGSGMVGAKYCYDESFDGSSSLSFEGILHEKATATFPLYNCDVPIPAEPLEVNISLCGNAESDVALSLLLDLPDTLNGTREVILRDGGQDDDIAAARNRRPVFSKRITYTEQRASYSPIDEELHGVAVPQDSAEQHSSLRGDASRLRSNGASMEAIGAHLQSSRSHTRLTTTLSPWTTRKYVVRDLRLGGSRSIRSIRIICARRRRINRSSSSAHADNAAENPTSPRRGLAATAAYRSCVGEIRMGPWRIDTPRNFMELKHLRASEFDWRHDGAARSSLKEGPSNSAGSPPGNALVLDLSLEWDVHYSGSLGNSDVNASVAAIARILHCDLWRHWKDGINEGWDWLGRAYGRKYRITGLQTNHNSDGEVILAVQQVNAMGYRQPKDKWHRLKLLMSRNPGELQHPSGAESPRQQSLP